METLTAFVRERAKWQPAAAAGGGAGKSDYLWGSDSRSGATAPRPTPATEIAAVLEVIRRRPEAGRKREELRWWRLDLGATDLRGADLSGVHLERALLYRVHLEHAIFFEPHLEGADLGEAHLEHALLIEAHLEGADLSEAHLEGADLRHAEGLTQDQIDSAKGDAAAKLPEGRTRPRHWTEPDAT